MGDVDRPLRPIAPRSAPPGGAGGAGGAQPPGGNGGGPPDDGRMKRASTACKECQKRRTRCTGMPCTECVAHCRECILDETADRRRKASARRVQEEYSNLREFVDQFVGVLREGDNAEAQHLINVIRSRASMETIRATILQLIAQNPNLRNLGQPGPNNDLDLNNPNNFFDPRQCRSSRH